MAVPDGDAFCLQLPCIRASANKPEQLLRHACAQCTGEPWAAGCCMLPIAAEPGSPLQAPSGSTGPRHVRATSCHSIPEWLGVALFSAGDGQPPHAAPEAAASLQPHSWYLQAWRQCRPRMAVHPPPTCCQQCCPPVGSPRSPHLSRRLAWWSAGGSYAAG